MPKMPLIIENPLNEGDAVPCRADKEIAFLGIGDAKNLAQPLKVSELVLMLKSEVEEKHHSVRVIGEISSFKQWRSGHCYFDIKDERALIPAVMFRPYFAKVPFSVADGQEALFCGRVSIYAASAKLQMIVETILPIGQGALALAFVQLKEKLKAEGLFDVKFKKPIKSLNLCVGIVTSSHGAVLRDMVRILKSRMPKVDILFSPVRVQGLGAGEEIKKAIELLDSTQACDVIIVGRGGGSLEDLWAFNEEIVARAIFKAKTPIISAVGHETDITISDFVADVRAATPTHAATIAVPKISDINEQLASAIKALKQQHQANLRRFLLNLAEQKRRLTDPRIGLFRHWQQIDEAGKRLNDNLHRLLQKQRSELSLYSKNLQRLAPFRQLRLKKEALFAAKTSIARLCPTTQLEKALRLILEQRRQLHQCISLKLRHGRQQFQQMVVKLDAISPLKVLSRGYCLVEDNNQQQILSSIGDFSIGQHIKIRMEDGVVGASVIDKE